MALRRDLSKDGIDFSVLKEAPTTVFVMIPAEELEEAASWLRIVTLCCLHAIYKYGEDESRKVLFMLSEFAQLGRMEAIPSAFAQGRKYGIRLWPVLQNKSQLDIYDHNANTIIGNSGCVFSFAPNDTDTAKFLSLRSGDMWAVKQSVSEDAKGETRDSWSLGREPLWPAEKLWALPEMHGLVWIQGQAAPQPVACPPYWTCTGPRS